MSGFFECCRYCVAPKRHPGCHSTCPDYLQQRAEYDKCKAIEDEKKRVKNGCRSQRGEAVRKAMKGKR